MKDRVCSLRRALATGVRIAACLLPALHSVLGAADLDEFKVKREQVFEFAQKPTVTRRGDRVTIAFETKGFCDVTVAIEEAATGTVPFSRREKGTVPLGDRVAPRKGGEARRSGPRANSAERGTGTSASLRSQSPFPRILRHLASGVLGPNAPAPFQKNAKKQTIVWDGKDDLGKYIDEKDHITVRVSLGLKPRLEEYLFDNPGRFYSPTYGFGVDKEGNLYACSTPAGIGGAPAWGAQGQLTRVYDRQGRSRTGTGGRPLAPRRQGRRPMMRRRRK